MEDRVLSGRRLRARARLPPAGFDAQPRRDVQFGPAAKSAALADAGESRLDSRRLLGRFFGSNGQRSTSTQPAQRLARHADIAAVQDQPVVRVRQKRSGTMRIRSSSTSRGVLPARAQPVGDAEDMGVDGDRRLAEGDVEHHVGGLAADAGQGLQRLAVAGPRRHAARRARARARSRSSPWCDRARSS